MFARMKMEKTLGDLNLEKNLDKNMSSGKYK
jgi:hypothetical protein